MAITKQKKQEILERLNGIVADAVSLVFVGFKGLSVGETTEMRQALKDENVHYFVAKKRLIKKALEDAKVAGELPELPGEIAVAYTAEDPTAPARLVHEHGKKFEGISILGGIFESAYADAGKMQEIATIPPVPVLRGMFVNVINAPIQGLVVSLSQIAEKKESA